ncbi:MAG: hypothetical protein ACOYW7_05365 [Nitrospirota bacterium]
MIKLRIQSESDDRAVEIIRSAISAEIKRLEMGLQKTEKQINRFEQEYKTTSDVFLKEFTAENMKNGDREYIEWAGELKIRDRIAEDLKRLREIEYVAQ